MDSNSTDSNSKNENEMKQDTQTNSKTDSKTDSKTETKSDTKTENSYFVFDFDGNSKKIRVQTKEELEILVEMRKEMKKLRKEYEEQKQQIRREKIINELLRNNVKTELHEEIYSYLNSKMDDSFTIDGKNISEFVYEYAKAKNLVNSPSQNNLLSKIKENYSQTKSTNQTAKEKIRESLSKLLKS